MRTTLGSTRPGSGGRRVVAGLMLAGFVLGACGYDRDGGGSAQPATAGASYAGALTGTDALLGAVVNRDAGEVLAYVCDGKTLAAWFKGKVEPDGSLSLSSTDGTRLNGRIDGGTLAGTVTLPGEVSSRAFSAGGVNAPAGLYRARGEVGGESAVGGWVVLADGRQRGAVRTSSGFTSTDTDLARPSKPVTSFTSNESDF